jgi:hypothetical protein
MRIRTTFLLLGFVVFFIGCASYPTNSRNQYTCQVLDQFGTPVSDAKALVVTTYFSADCLHYGRMIKTVVSRKKCTTSHDGIFSFEWVSSYDETPQLNITITKSGFSSINYLYNQQGDLANESPRRLMLPEITNERIPTTKSITSGGGNGRITIRTPWLGKPLYFDLEKKSFVESGGDFEISIERADFSDPNKKNSPFSLAIKAVNGTLLPCPRSDYDWSFTHCVPSWGTNQPILFHSPNSRDYPNVWTFFTFHTRNRKNVGRATMGIDVIAERKYNDASIPADTRALVGLEIEAFFNSEGSPALGENPLRL